MPRHRTFAHAALVVWLSCSFWAGASRAEPPPRAPSAPPAPAASTPGTPAPPAPSQARLPAPAPVPAAATATLVTSRLARDAIAAALRAARFPEGQRGLASLAARVRASAALPEVSVRASRSTDQSLRLSPTVDDPSNYSQLGGAGLLLAAGLLWHTDRLLFDRDELSVERLRVDRADAAARLSQRVLETLFAWQRATLRTADSSLLPEDRDAAALAKVEAEVTLDVLTAGWFGARPGSAP